tara:strand:+ start:2283 stop:3050 length:768 start_codon:yes stop_codon:yes gene_type:complete
MDESKTKIALLILATSKNRDNWVTIKDTYLFNMTLKTFLLTQDKEHKYLFYVGIDKDDRLFDKEDQQQEITRFSKAFPNVEFKFITMEAIQKGYVTLMWNKLFEDAFKQDCEYFYQCGDDMEFKTKGWINDCIKALKTHNDIGLAGPINNNSRILTQAFVSRKHMEIFGWFFPKEIKNWCCDDWYNMVYHPKYLYPLHNHLSINNGGQPRYDINNNPNFTGKTQMTFGMNVNKLRQEAQQLANQHKKLIETYLNS